MFETDCENCKYNPYNYNGKYYCKIRGTYYLYMVHCAYRKEI